MSKTHMQQMAESLTNEQLATLLLPVTDAAMRKAEETLDPADGVAAFVLTAAGYRLAQLAEAEASKAAVIPPYTLI